MEADLYDEFGNYVGPELDSDEESEDEDEVGEEEVVEYVSWELFVPYEYRETKLSNRLFDGLSLFSVVSTSGKRRWKMQFSVFIVNSLGSHSKVVVGF